MTYTYKEPEETFFRLLVCDDDYVVRLTSIELFKNTTSNQDMVIAKLKGDFQIHAITMSGREVSFHVLKQESAVQRFRESKYSRDYFWGDGSDPLLTATATLKRIMYEWTK
jgi:hypothetical protein